VRTRIAAGNMTAIRRYTWLLMLRIARAFGCFCNTVGRKSLRSLSISDVNYYLFMKLIRKLARQSPLRAL
jgi:hypothetical protein